MSAYIAALNVALVLLTMSGTAQSNLVAKPVEIGKDAFCVYECPLQDGTAFDWKFGDDPKAYPCDSSTFSGQPGQPKLEVTYDGSLRKSTLRVFNISTADDKKQIQCVLKNSSILQSWRLEAYYKPEFPACSVVQIKQSAVRFHCATPKVFPDLDCNVTYWENVTRKQFGINNTFWNKTKATVPGGLFSCSCSIDIEDLEPGVYDFFGVLKPALSTYVHKNSVPKVLDKIAITRASGKINVRQVTEMSVVCSETEPVVEFLCEATNFNRMPELVWHVGLTDERFVRPVHKNGTVYFTTLLLRVTSKYRDARINCAEYKFEHLVAGQQLLLVEWLKPPNLTTNFHSHPRDIRFPAHLNLTFSCSLEFEDIYVDNIRLHCYHESNTLVIKESSGRDASAVLEAGIPYQYVNCECSARHKLNCSVKPKKVTINFDDPTPATVKTDAAGVGEGHFLILLGCACLVFFVLILYIVVTTVKKRCRRRLTQPDHYEDVKGVVQETRRHTASALPYAISEVRPLAAERGVVHDAVEGDQLYVNIPQNLNSRHYSRARLQSERTYNNTMS